MIERENSRIYIPTHHFWWVLLLTFCVIFIGRYGLIYFYDRAYKSQFRAIQLYANSFKIAVNTVHAYVASSGRAYVPITNGVLYVNQFGFPASTSGVALSSSYVPTSAHCMEVWHSIQMDNAQVPNTALQVFRVTADVVESRICRYRIFMNRENTVFFDYHFTTGQVKVEHANNKRSDAQRTHKD